MAPRWNGTESPSIHGCRESPGGEGRLRQTQLSFLRATPSSDLRLDDTVEGEGAVPLNFSSISLNTTTVGQQTDYGQKSGLELADDV